MDEETLAKRHPQGNPIRFDVIPENMPEIEPVSNWCECTICTGDEDQES